MINSGCANALTGSRGVADAEAMTARAAERLGISPAEVLVCSTGLIGAYLPLDRVVAGIDEAVDALGPDDLTAAEAIMTTDTGAKRAAVAASGGWSVGGMAKGTGMIAPDLATMLAVITTDAQVAPEDLRPLLASAADASFGSITIDGASSTNDTVLVFANGAARVAPSSDDFGEALGDVCSSLAHAIVSDGEEATKVVRVRVRGAADAAEAHTAARAVAESLLVKATLHGCEPNWGPIAVALGCSGAAGDYDALTISMGGTVLLDRGVPTGDRASAEARVGLARPEVVVECDLHVGDGAAEMLGTDLSPDYVRVNADLSYDWLPVSAAAMGATHARSRSSAPVER